MRAGGFAEPRVIRLINRRFVPFFFNTSGMGEGDDDLAAAFVEGKVENPSAYLSCFSPVSEGEHMATSALYASKDELFQFLLDVLASRPDLARETAEEAALFESAAHSRATPATLLAAATVHEELGRYEQARPLAERALSSLEIAPEEWARGFHLLVAMARYEGRWDLVGELCARAERRQTSRNTEIEASIRLELGYRALATRDYAAARLNLEQAIALHPQARRTGELRFYAGVACFFSGDEERADYHWCWVNENIPDDVMARRCYIAAARSAMPYANPELDGFEATGLPGGSIRLIKEAYAEALERYRALEQARNATDEEGWAHRGKHASAPSGVDR